MVTQCLYHWPTIGQTRHAIWEMPVRWNAKSVCVYAIFKAQGVIAPRDFTDNLTDSYIYLNIGEVWFSVKSCSAITPACLWNHAADGKSVKAPVTFTNLPLDVTGALSKTFKMFRGNQQTMFIKLLQTYALNI